MITLILLHRKEIKRNRNYKRSFIEEMAMINFKIDNGVSNFRVATITVYVIIGL